MTKYVPFAIYEVPARILRHDVRPLVSSGERSYVQPLERIGKDAYCAYVAASEQALRSSNEEGIIVTKLTDEQLALGRLVAVPCTSARYFVVPARILPEVIRPSASSACLCYLRVVRCWADGSVDVEVAALPHRLGSEECVHEGVLSHGQFGEAIPWTRSLASRPTCEVRQRVESHAYCVSGDPVFPSQGSGPRTEEPSLGEERSANKKSTVHPARLIIGTLCPILVPRQLLVNGSSHHQPVELVTPTAQSTLSRVRRRYFWLHAALFALEHLRQTVGGVPLPGRSAACAPGETRAKTPSADRTGKMPLKAGP